MIPGALLCVCLIANVAYAFPTVYEDTPELTQCILSAMNDNQLNQMDKCLDGVFGLGIKSGEVPLEGTYDEEQSEIRACTETILGEIVLKIKQGCLRSNRKRERF